MEVDKARELISRAGLFFHADEDEPQFRQMLNMNDTWGWGCADGEDVTDEELPRLAELFITYGYCGVLYWVSSKRNNCKSEFHDVNRHIEFVRREEELRLSEPSSSKRAYAKIQYTIGINP